MFQKFKEEEERKFDEMVCIHLVEENKCKRKMAEWNVEFDKIIKDCQKELVEKHNQEVTEKEKEKKKSAKEKSIENHRMWWFSTMKPDPDFMED